VILEQDAPERIFSQPSEPETRRFLERIVAAGRM
jgi:ABC-type polar amino acid transport system ATPase subunit